jgi:putative transposase
VASECDFFANMYCSRERRLSISAKSLSRRYESKRELLAQLSLGRKFFTNIKDWLIQGGVSPREELKRVVFEYIEVVYNRNRRHSVIVLICPAAFEAKRVA